MTNGLPFSVGLVVVTPIADVESVGARGGKRACGSDIEFKAALAQIEAGKPLLPLVIGPDIEAELYAAAVTGRGETWTRYRDDRESVDHRRPGAFHWVSSTPQAGSRRRKHQPAIGKWTKVHDSVGACGPELWRAAAGLGPDDDRVNIGFWKIETSGCVEPASVCGPRDAVKTAVINLAGIGSVNKA